MAALDAFSCSRALVVSGLDSNPRKRADFVANADAIGVALAATFSEVDVEHWSTYDTVTDALDVFIERVQARHAVVYTNHGGRRNWTSVLHTGDFPLDFLGSHPLVAAFACSTGYYQGINSIADTFLDSQAGGYIGSTELAHRPTTLEAGLMFADRWPAPGISAAKALRNTERALLSGHPSDYQRLWVLQFNLYGDPKYGLCPAAQAGQAVPGQPPSVAEARTSATVRMVVPGDPRPAALPPSSLAVTVPDYQVTTTDGLDTARIPGGLMLLEPGRPMVPIYVVTQDYPSGYTVQEVTLASRSGMSTATGLHLPLVTDDPTSAQEAGLSRPAHLAPGTYPEEDYSWEIDEGPDGSTTLTVRIYPFTYDAATTDVQFFRNYTFEVRVLSSTLSIVAFSAGQHACAQSEQVTAGLWLSNTGAPQDVVVSAVIKSAGSGEVVDRLLLRTLDAIASLSSFELRWDSTGFPAGDYTLAAELKGTGGDVLDRAEASFTLGLTGAEIVHFAASPGQFEIGESIALSLTFANTGTVPLTGAAVLQIQDSEGDPIWELSHDVANLAPGSSISLSDTWDTSGAARDEYRALAYVLYEGTATEPSTAILRSIRPIYLPLVLNRTTGRP